MISKTILSMLSAAVAMTAVADHSIPLLFTEDWSGPIAESGWEAYGSGKTPAGSTAQAVGTDGWALVEFPFGVSYMASTSTTAQGGKVGCRLVSPAIAVPQEGAVLSLDAVNWNPDKSLDNKLSVYVVADGEEAGFADTEPLYSRRIKANSYPSPEHVAVALKQFAGQDVRVVIVNDGNDCGLLGLGNVTVGMYDAEIRNLSPLYVKSEEVWRPEVTVASAACFEGYEAVLKVDDAVVERVSVDVFPEEGYASYPIRFSTELTADGHAGRPYEILLTPADTAMPEISSRGTVVFGGGYPGVAVEEEGTGEQCGNCPYGAAGLERFSALYSERFFGIAVHCTDQFSGEAMRAPGYALQFEKNPANPILSLPSALLNRSRSVNPSDIPAIEKAVGMLLEAETPVKAAIDRVDYDETTSEVKVRFSVTACADIAGAPLCAAAVLTADGLTGTGRDWTQANYLSGATRPSGVDDSWWEYLRFYFEYPAKHILSGDYKFDHVAMGIYPDFNGAGLPLADELTAGVASEEEISFVMPMQIEANGFGVQDAMNTAVTVLIMDSRTGEVLTASRVEAADYNRDLSKVDEILAATHIPSIPRFYDLAGRQVDPTRCMPGIYIRTDGVETRKITIRK